MIESGWVSTDRIIGIPDLPPSCGGCMMLRTFLFHGLTPRG